jgi:hypothetical protein
MKYITAANKRHSHLQLDNNLLACAWPVSPGFGLQHSFERDCRYQQGSKSFDLHDLCRTISTASLCAFLV